MKPQVLFDLSLISILAFGVKGQNWNVTVPSLINATKGSDVTIPCNFTYPQIYYTVNVQVFWKMKVASNISFNDNDKNAFIYYTNDSYVLESYRNRTKLIGDKSKGNCTLVILKVMDDVSNIYVRIIGSTNQYSFYNYVVNISVYEVAAAAKGEAVDISTPTLYVATAVLSFGFLIVTLVTGIYCYRKYRSQSFTREESGYYANFSRASPNPAKSSDAAAEKQDNTKCPEPKVIDEPIYVNTETLTGQVDRLDHKENIYANVNYSK